MAACATLFSACAWAKADCAASSTTLAEVKAACFALMSAFKASTALFAFVKRSCAVVNAVSAQPTFTLAVGV